MSSEKLQFELGRPTAVIASEINTIKVQTQKLMLQASIDIGKRLVEAKEQVPHGAWGQWLKENVEYSQSTATNLMNIYREYGENSQALGNLSYSNAVALLGIDPNEREEFAKEVNAEEISLRQLEKLVSEKKQIEKEKQEMEEQLKREQAARQEELQQMQLQLDEAHKQSAEALDAHNEINRLAQELAVAESNAEKLQAELKNKPIEATTVEVIPDEVQQELERLRQQAESSGTDPAEVKFKVKFETLVNQFRETIEAVDAISNAEMQAKYKQAMHKLLDKMRLTLESE